MENIIQRLYRIRDEEGTLLEPDKAKQQKLLKKRQSVFFSVEHGKEDAYGKAAVN